MGVKMDMPWKFSPRSGQGESGLENTLNPATPGRRDFSRLGGIRGWRNRHGDYI
jgi:hypothetical protein